MSSLMVIANTAVAPLTPAVAPAAERGAASGDGGGQDHARQRARRSGVAETAKAEEANVPELRPPPMADKLRPGLFVDFLI